MYFQAYPLIFRKNLFYLLFFILVLIPAIIFIFYSKEVLIKPTGQHTIGNVILVALKDPSNTFNTSVIPFDENGEQYLKRLNDLIDIYDNRLKNDPQNNNVRFNLARVYIWMALYYRGNDRNISEKYSFCAIEEARLVFEKDKSYWQAAELISTVYLSYLCDTKNAKIWLNKAAFSKNGNN